MKTNKILILGGTGFIGHHLVNRLVSRGFRCTIVTRHPQRHRDMLPGGRVKMTSVDIFDPEALAGAVYSCSAVVNLVGILNEQGSASFKRMHAELPGIIADACVEAGVRRFLHMSALHADADQGVSDYLKSIGSGEAALFSRRVGQLHSTCFQPSVVFGPGDTFFNRFAGLLRQIPGPFPLACPDAQFAPVFVGDVVDAMSAALESSETHGRCYSLCGPRVFTLRALVDYTARQIGSPRRIIGLPDGLSRLQAHLLGRVPGKPFTIDNYRSLQQASICNENGLERLGVTPTDIDAVVPFYLGTRSARAGYAGLRRIRPELKR